MLKVMALYGPPVGSGWASGALPNNRGFVRPTFPLTVQSIAHQNHNDRQQAHQSASSSFRQVCCTSSFSRGSVVVSLFVSIDVFSRSFSFCGSIVILATFESCSRWLQVMHACSKCNVEGLSRISETTAVNHVPPANSICHVGLSLGCESTSFCYQR